VTARLIEYMADRVVAFAEGLGTDDRRTYLDAIRAAYTRLEDDERIRQGLGLAEWQFRREIDDVIAEYGAEPGSPLS
jgi:hypothetical protein